MSTERTFPHSVQLLNHSVLSVVAVGSFLSVLGGSVYVSDSFGQFSSSSPASDADVVSDTDGGGGGGALFRAPKDNTRNQWQWDANKGWTLDILEQTYETGWHWLWTPDGWVWTKEAEHAAATPELRMYRPAAASEASTMTRDDVPGCFAVDGSWVSDRDSCASDQLSAAMKADETALPEAYQQLLQDTAPLTEQQEHAVETVLEQRFDTAFVMHAKDTAVRTASNVITRLQILKESPSVTDTERAYFVEKIVGLQKALAETSSISDKDDASSLQKDIASLTTEVANYVDEHGIYLSVENAPSATTILQSAKRISDALPYAFDAVEKAGYSTDQLRSMHASVQSLLADITVRCSLGRDCNRITDVVQQLQQTVTELRELLDSIGNSTLKADVERSFDARF